MKVSIQREKSCALKMNHSIFFNIIFSYIERQFQDWVSLWVHWIGRHFFSPSSLRLFARLPLSFSTEFGTFFSRCIFSITEAKCYRKLCIRFACVLCARVYLRGKALEAPDHFVAVRVSLSLSLCASRSDKCGLKSVLMEWTIRSIFTCHSSNIQIGNVSISMQMVNRLRFMATNLGHRR